MLAPGARACGAPPRCSRGRRCGSGAPAAAPLPPPPARAGRQATRGAATADAPSSPASAEALFAAQPRLLTARLKRSGSWRDAAALLDAAGGAANHIHLAAAVVQAAQLLRQAEQQPAAPDAGACLAWAAATASRAAARHARDLEPRHTANLLWALARCGGGGAAGGGAVGGAVAELLELQRDQLRHGGAAPQDLANSLWALATLRVAPPPAWLAAFWPAAQAALPTFPLHELASTAWAAAALRVAVPAAWLGAFWAASGQQLAREARGGAAGGGAPPCQALANMAHALASLGAAPPPDWLAAWFEASAPALARSTPGQLTMSLWAVAGWRAAPPTAWLAALADAAAAAAPRLSDQELATAAASCYQLLLQGCCAGAAAQGGSVSVQQLERGLGALLSAAAGRVQTLPVRAASALAWASAGLPTDGGAGAGQQQQQQLLRQHQHQQQQQQQQRQQHQQQPPPAAGAWLQEFVALRSSAPAPRGDGGEALQLLWLAAKVGTLPASGAWCAAARAALEQQHGAEPKQLAQASWSVAQLLELAHPQPPGCGELQQELDRLGAAVLGGLTRHARRMTSEQLLEAALSAARITACVQGARQHAGALVQALTAAAQPGAAGSLGPRQQLALAGALHQLLRSSLAAAGPAELAALQQAVHAWVGAAAQLVEAASLTPAAGVRAGLQLLAVAQLPVRAGAAAEAAGQLAEEQLLPVEPACRAALLGLLGGLSSLGPEETLGAAALCARLRVLLPAGAAADMAYALQGHLPGYSPEQLLHVLVLLRHLRPPPAQRGTMAPARRAVMAAWLQASLRHMLAALGEQQQLEQEQLEQQQLEQQPPGGPDFLALSVVRLARLHVHPGEPWLAVHGRLLSAQLPAMPAEQLSLALLGLARLGHRPAEPAAAALLAASGAALPRMTRGQLVRTLHALAKLRVAPGEAWLATFYGAALSAPGSFGVSGFGMVVWALARVGAAPDAAWLQALLDATFEGCSAGGEGPGSEGVCGGGGAAAPALHPQHLANMLCAFAKLHFAPGAPWMAWFRGQLGAAAGPLAELDHFHIEWAWRELADQRAAMAQHGGGGGE
ncbi:hypothetical protein HT031_004505 [Scenedesmus sp. PABB004]|nr:hypothetical protein HT031_004505 [Scenedesmus sp. PABB004]